MRSLTKKQKEVIEKHVDVYGLDNIDELIEVCENINDYETCWCDVQRYAEDYYMKAI